jgi:hypothetical protein
MTDNRRKILQRMAELERLTSIWIESGTSLGNPYFEEWKELSKLVRPGCIELVQLFLDSGILSTQEDFNPLIHGSKEVAEIQGNVIIIKMVPHD